MKTALLALVFTASAVASEETASGEPDLTTAKWLHFGLLLGLLVYGWLKLAAPALRARLERIGQDLSEARRSQAASLAKVAEIERRLGNLTAEVESFRQESQRLLAREAERIRQETAALVMRIEARGQQEIASFTKHVQGELKAELGRLAVSLAAARLRSGLSRNHHADLLMAFAADLEAAGSRN